MITTERARHRADCRPMSMPSNTNPKLAKMKKTANRKTTIAQRGTVFQVFIRNSSRDFAGFMPFPKDDTPRPDLCAGFCKRQAAGKPENWTQVRGRFALLHRAFGAQAAELEGAGQGVLRVEAQIVGGGPEPEAGDGVSGARAGLGTQAHEHIVLAGGGEVGGRIGVLEDELDVVAGERFFESGVLNGTVELDGDGKSVAVKDGRVQHLERERRPAVGGEQIVVAADARFRGGQADGSRFAQRAEQIKGGLAVVNGAREGLEAEQADRLLVEFVHGGAAELAGRLKQRDGGQAHG